MPKKSSTNKKIKIYSEAFPPDSNGYREKLIPSSDSHDLMDGVTIDVNKIIYKSLSKDQLDEIKKLHKEWFPIDYNDKWYNKIFEDQSGYYFTIGAFYKKESYDKEIIIGLALCEWSYISDYFRNHTGTKTIKKICDNINFSEEVKSYLACEGYRIAYIMTIGVLDEYRKLHIGSKILDIIINQLLYDDLCVGIYLDVVSYNNAAIKFYEKNKFENVTVIKNYYNIKNEVYDSIVFVRIFTREEKDEFRKKHRGICSKTTNIILSPLYLVLKIIFYFLFCQCFRGKIKMD